MAVQWWSELETQRTLLFDQRFPFVVFTALFVLTSVALLVALALEWQTEPYLLALGLLGLLTAGISIRSRLGYVVSQQEYNRLRAEFEEAMQESVPFADSATLQNKESQRTSNQ